MYHDLYEYVSQCVPCQSRNLTAIPQPIQESHISPYPWHSVSIDCCGPYDTTSQGNKYLICFMDMYSRWPVVVPSPDITSDSIIKALLEQIICVFGAPRFVITDSGPCFTSKAFTDTLAQLNIKEI